MGKTTAAGIFAALGIPVWNADDTVHQLYEKDGAAVGPVAALCPEALHDGGIDRGRLKAWIAQEPDRLKSLEAVVHPLVARDREHFITQATSDIVALDIPLLFETGAEAWLDAVAVVTTDPDTQRARVLSRPGMTAQQFDLILAKQMPDADKRQRADYIIPSDTIDSATQAIEDIVDHIRNRPHA